MISPKNSILLTSITTDKWQNDTRIYYPSILLTSRRSNILEKIGVLSVILGKCGLFGHLRGSDYVTIDTYTADMLPPKLF